MAADLAKLCALLLEVEFPDGVGDEFDESVPPRPLPGRTPGELAEQIRTLPAAPPELATLRDWLCDELGLAAGPPSPGSQFPPSRILAEAERLKTYVTALLEGAEVRRWLAIDDEILAGRLVFAIKEIRHEFAVGVGAGKAIYDTRLAELRVARPFGFALLPIESL